ncbi:ATP-binding protein [Hymenobacter caeli]|uniref:histidine kinase n=1 Tax=Hymenobacter caeli TaxID=2735894 RepID=A0ABX2FU95_9BACT|nr:hybrid sensor histidine kinase/response regulator [Hymenobacter caeli]NRT20761.1 signal transduction histidine kinase/CheY-like chemotaxis protein [Hymenobacter caeli]
MLNAGTHRWLCVLALLLGVPAARGQSVFLRSYGPAEGLAQPFIYALAQDGQGFLWLGTAEGLVRYDGTRFATLTRRDGLADDFVVALALDATGRLWARHYAGGYSAQTAPGGRFARAAGARAPAALRALPPGPAPVDTARLGRYCRRYALHLPAGAVPTCLLEDRDGNAWLGTAGRGLWRHADRHLRLCPTPTGPSGKQPALVTLPDSDGLAIWGTFVGSEFFKLTTESPGPKLVHTPAPPIAGAVAALLARPKTLGGGLWLGSADGRVWAQAAPGGPATFLLSADAPGPVTALAYAPATGLWVGTAADGLYLLPTDHTQPTRHFTTANGLLHNSIYALLADRAGRVWVGTHGTGLAAYEPGTGRFAYVRLPDTSLDVNALAEDADGRVWAGTNGQGLYGRLATGQWQRYHLGPSTATGYVYNLRALPPAIPGAAPRLLLVHRQGLSLFDTRSHAFAPLAAPDDPLARDLLGPLALAGPAGGPPAVAWASTRAGLLRLDLAAVGGPATAPPGLVLAAAEVDGAARPPGALGQLPAGRHRLRFAFQGVSLAAGGGALEYQYRLRGLADEWSHPGPAAEAQFPGLDAGRYVLEARARRGPAGPWGPGAAAGFGIGTPFWRTWWFAGLLVLGSAGAGAAAVRGRERLLRQQKLVLERTVRERTGELRRQNAHIEAINADLVVARDAAEASRRAKAQFLANMSHEIRTPMNAVLGLTHLLHATRPTAEQGEYLTAIESSSQNLLVILNDILDSSKMEAGKLTLEQVPFRLPEALRRLPALFRFAVASKNLFFTLDIAPDVPAAVLGDSVRLHQILVNLVGNAIKFTKRGGVTLTVTAAPDLVHPATHALLHFAVRDTGIGIPADQLTAIFEDFSQANASTTREFGGTGLGLSIARNLVRLHGGQLGVRSEEGHGAEFFFDLPYAVADAAAAQPEAAVGVLPPFEPALRVLVAEDNALNQLVARKTLEAWNVAVTLADNGRLAVAAVRAADPPFDAVLMDVQMPELDGYAATAQLRQYFPDAGRLPIIGLTASVLPEDRSLALAAGMNDTLAKPFDPGLLYARLAHFTGRLGAEAAPAAPTEFAPPPPDAGPAPLHPDWHLLEELAGGNEAFLRQIVQTFLQEAPALELLLHAAAGADPAQGPALARAAHKLKGQVAYFGVPVLHTQLDELERAAQFPGQPCCLPLVQSVRAQLAALYPQLQERA